MCRGGYYRGYEGEYKEFRLWLICQSSRPNSTRLRLSQPRTRSSPTGSTFGFSLGLSVQALRFRMSGLGFLVTPTSKQVQASAV